MPLPDLAQLCVDIDVTPGTLCITLPGPSEICVQFPSLVPPSPDELVKQLFAQLNAALAPLTPIFNIIDVVVAIFDCIKAISTLDPVEIVNCLPGLAERVAALLRLIPQLTIPVLVVQFLEVLILFLRGQRNQIVRQLAYIQRILVAELAATRPGNLGLSSAIICSKDDLRNLVQWFNEGATPLNRLIGVINAFFEIIPPLQPYAIPDLSEIDPDRLEDAVALFDVVIDILTALRNAIAPIAGQITGPFEEAAEAVEDG